MRALMLHMDVRMARSAWMRRSGLSAIRYPLSPSFLLALPCRQARLPAKPVCSSFPFLLLPELTPAFIVSGPIVFSGQRPEPSTQSPYH